MMHLGMFLKLFFCLLLKLAIAAAVEDVVEFSGAKPGCISKCGSITIPYPFGIGVECAQSNRLNITCNSSSTPAKPYYINLEVVGISPTELRVASTFLAVRCYNTSGGLYHSLRAWINLEDTLYTFSYKSNKFISVGCNTIAFIQGYEREKYTSGCISMCRNKESAVTGSCAGAGCCQTDIPKGLKYFEAYIRKPFEDWIPESLTYSPCSYAFLADQKNFNFSASDISDPTFLNRSKDVPVVLDWVVDNITCVDAYRNITSYACTENTDCVESDNGLGYRCKCRNGYKGNPYLSAGCQDIDECADLSTHECLGPENCVNKLGGYDCTCPHGSYGDGIRNKKGCTQERKKFATAKIILGFGLGILVLLFGICWLYFVIKNRKLAKLKEKFFKQNGGLLLQQHQISLHKTGGAIRLYSSEELQKATNNYDESYILGRGGNGTVYKGVLPPENKIIAIKKSKVVDENQIDQFINEVVILTQINHKNVVKLLGCCLETQVPLLVYEFISNGTLFQHIHSRPNVGTVSSKFSWYNCLRIATEIATALAYLHSAASIPIIHRDVKSTNILLDDNYSAKVADFGASRLIPLDQTQVSTIIQGTLGYLDPECYQTGRLTEKSDVYSFGVVLVEILTAKTPLSFERSDECTSLAAYFISMVRQSSLLQIVDSRLVDEADKVQIQHVADLATRCLTWKGEERPTMREVVGELETFMRLAEQHPWDEEKMEETVNLLDDHSDLYPRSAFSISTSGESSGQYSISNSLISPLQLPR